MKENTHGSIEGNAWMGAVAAAVGAPMQGVGLGRKLPKVRVAVVGVGSRGIAALHRIAMIPGTEVAAISDFFQERIDGELKWLEENGKPAPALTAAGPDGYRRICESDAVDVVYNVSPWHMHAPIAVCAMEHGKVALNEVPGALTVEECWQLVETSERTKMPCMMLENCCYGEEEMLMLNLAKQGFFGEITHGEGAYIHDLRSLQLATERYHTMDGQSNMIAAGKPGWSLDFYTRSRGNHYPTHGLGPLAKYMDINRGDNFDFLVSVESRQASYEHYAHELFDDWRKDVKVATGDMSQTLIRTKLGRTILLQLDTCSPRPYSRINLVSGTRGMAVGFPEFRIAFEEKTGDGLAHQFRSPEETQALREKYAHPLWKAAGAVAQKVGGHGGMDFIMDLRWSYCLQNGLPLDTDVYDLAAWSAMVELTRASVEGGSIRVDCPDFTRGAWKTAPGFTIDEIDLSKLPGDFSDARHDEHVDANERQESMSH